MPSDNSAAIQTAIFAKLTGNAPLMALVSGVYDIAPVDTPLPYITIGNDSARSTPTKTSDGQVITVSISVWSTYAGRAQAKTINAAIADVLHNAALAPAISCQLQDSLTRLDSRNRLVEGVTRYRVLVRQ